jgi:poly-gamma-glutamate synthesis protein (capsule biosynthesis protein)
VHGHSSHHAKAVEVYRRRPIFYGCGDFVNDYEGIEGGEEFRPGLRLMHFVDIDAKDGLGDLEVVVLRARRLRLEPASKADAEWIAAMLRREGARLGGAPAGLRVAAVR